MSEQEWQMGTLAMALMWSLEMVSYDGTVFSDALSSGS